MNNFHSGQRVRILWSHGWPELRGTLGTIAAAVPADKEYEGLIKGDWYVSPDIWGTTRAPRRGTHGGYHFAPCSAQLEPLVEQTFEQLTRTAHHRIYEGRHLMTTQLTNEQIDAFNKYDKGCIAANEKNVAELRAAIADRNAQRPKELYVVREPSGMFKMASSTTEIATIKDRISRLEAALEVPRAVSVVTDKMVGAAVAAYANAGGREMRPAAMRPALEAALRHDGDKT